MAVIVLFCIFFAYNVVDDSSPFMIRITESDIKNAVNNAIEPIVVVLDNDVRLTESLTIPAGKDVTLTSCDDNDFYKLIGVDGESVIVVEGGGVLRLKGVIITHENDAYGNGIFIDHRGTLMLYDGVICDNTLHNVNALENVGGGVRNFGRFIMSGGRIVNNTAGGGGGLLNWGSFSMSGGEISGNTAYGHGGGVNMYGSDFSMSGGKISNNTAAGGGVFSSNAKFSLVGDGVICGNNAEVGGGVYNQWGNFGHASN
jgi:hypothetical protein